jgi:hypothetical protein
MNVMPDGANGVGVWLSGIVHVGLSNTLHDKTLSNKFYGVGVVEARLSPDDLVQAKVIQSNLCQAARQKPSTELEPMRPPFVYSVACMEHDQLTSYQGNVHDLPRELAVQLDGYQRKALRSYFDQGRALVKLDVVLASVQRKADKFLVSVKFVNSGRYPIVMSRPDTWQRLLGDRLDAGAIHTSVDDDWGFELAGAPLVNEAEFPDKTLTIPARANVTFKFLAVPYKKIKRGTYSIGALVVTGLSGEGVVATMGRVGFTTDNSKPGTVTFDHDYPSTPGERENFEAQKREAMSSQPVYPGSTFVEDGYYRAVSDSGQCSRFVERFYKDHRVPEVKNVMDSDGQPLHGKHLGWTWEADPPADMFAFDTQCKPGRVCPRTGRWFARIESNMTAYPPKYDDSLGEIIHCKQGQLMPAPRKASGQIRDEVRWEWTGV